MEQPLLQALSLRLATCVGPQAGKLCCLETLHMVFCYGRQRMGLHGWDPVNLT